MSAIEPEQGWGAAEAITSCRHPRREPNVRCRRRGALRAPGSQLLKISRLTGAP
jgi:hypothetical protein